jgi:hypothetical protein
VKLPLGALLTFVGYAILWTGIMNLRVTYTVQGTTVTPSGKLYTLMDAFTCGEGATPATTGGSSSGTPTSSGSSGVGNLITGALGKNNPVSGNCNPQPGDTKLPGGFIWRPIPNSFSKIANIAPWARGIVNQANGQLIGPC